MKWLIIFPEDATSVPFYTGWLARAGIDYEISSPRDPYPGRRGYDALLLSGGGDVDPARYGAPVVHAKTGGINPERDERELALVQDFLGGGRPVFGICRGMQLLNVAFRGKLIQHVPDALGPAATEMHSRADSYDALHGLNWVDDSKLKDAMGDAREVNSSHHQAILPDTVGRSLRVVARSPAGIVEAIESFDHGGVISAVQWHPERMPQEHPASSKLLELWKKWV